MWREGEFERWFLANPILPGAEPVVLIARQRALRRVVDLLCIDGEGALVLLEVKNEASSRTAVGQALEYLSQYEESHLESLLEELAPEAALAVRQALDAHGWFGHKVTRSRRVYLVAPSFDLPTQAAVAFLNDRFAPAGLQLGLIAAKGRRNGFTLEYVDIVRPRPLQQLRGQCAVTGRQRLFYVLPVESGSLVVNLGLLRDGQLRPPRPPAATQRLVRRRTGSLIPYDGVFTPDASQLGSVWRHRNRMRRAVVLAAVKRSGNAADTLIYFALEEDGQLRGYRIRKRLDFERWYRRDEDAQLDWRALLRPAV